MKKLLLILLLLVNTIVFAQIVPLSNICNGNTFDLNSKIPELIANQNPSTTPVSFHLTQSDAVNNVNPIANASAFVGTNGQEIWANVLDSANSTSSIAAFSLFNAINLSATTIIIASSFRIITLGGNPPFEYSFNGGFYNNNNNFLNLNSGTYIYTVRDSNGCTFSGTVVITNNSLPTLSINNATAIEGGTLTFLLSLNATSIQDTVINLVTSDNTASTSDYTPIATTVTIPAGQTNMTVAVPTTQDFLSCESSETLNLNADIVSGNTANLTATGEGLISNIPATGGLQVSIITNGNTATVTAIGGVAPYEYSLDGFMAFSNVITDLFTGPHEISVTDSTGCTLRSIIFITCGFDFTINGSLDIPSSTFNVELYSLAQIPLVGPFSYTFDGGTSISISPNNQFTLFANTFNYGNHTVIVTDSNGCSVTRDFIGGTSNTYVNLSTTGTYNDYNNDGFVNLGDVINYQYTVTNPNNNAIENVTVSNSQISINGNTIPTLNANSSDSTTFTGVQVLTQQNINSGIVFDSASVTASVNGQPLINYSGIQTNLNISRGFKLNAFFDTNANGIQEGVEVNYAGGNFTYQLSGATAQNVYSNNGIFYLYESNLTSSYNFSYNLPNSSSFCGSNYTVATGSYSNVTLSGTGITTYNFAISQNNCVDLAVYLQRVGGPRPGFINMNRILFRNDGNSTIPSGTITFNKDNAVTITSTDPATTATVNGFTYNFTNLLPNQSRYIYVQMQVPVIPIVSIGQLVTSTASGTIPVNDVNVSNNTSTLTQDIRGSYDPNDKQESHGPQIVYSGFTANDYLTYKIRFENTGNADAITVKVNDILNNKLDETSIKMIDASHSYVLKRTGSNLEWTFAGIDLPPSVPDTQIGHGYVVFQVKPKLGYVLGDVIPNTANIYFDFNPAIVTNTWTTEFVTVLSNNSFTFSDLKVYPNPTDSVLNISNNEKIDNFELTNILGQTIISQKINSLNATLDLSGFTNGVYFVKVTSNDLEQIIKVIKK